MRVFRVGISKNLMLHNIKCNTKCRKHMTCHPLIWLLCIISIFLYIYALFSLDYYYFFLVLLHYCICSICSNDLFFCNKIVNVCKMQVYYTNRMENYKFCSLDSYNSAPPYTTVTSYYIL